MLPQCWLGLTLRALWFSWSFRWKKVEHHFRGLRPYLVGHYQRNELEVVLQSRMFSVCVGKRLAPFSLDRHPNCIVFALLLLMVMMMMMHFNRTTHCLPRFAPYSQSSVAKVINQHLIVGHDVTTLTSSARRSAQWTGLIETRAKDQTDDLRTNDKIICCRTKKIFLSDSHSCSPVVLIRLTVRVIYYIGVITWWTAVRK